MNVCLLSLFLIVVVGLFGCGLFELLVLLLLLLIEVVVVKMLLLQYLFELVCMGVGGISMFKVIIGIDGKLSEVVLLIGVGNLQLDELVKIVVQGWQFKVVICNGQLVLVIIQVLVSFNLLQLKLDQCFVIEECLCRGG